MRSSFKSTIKIGGATLSTCPMITSRLVSVTRNRFGTVTRSRNSVCTRVCRRFISVTRPVRSATVIQSPGRALRTTLSMMPASMLPMRVVEDSAMVALSSMPIRPSNGARKSPTGSAMTTATTPASVNASMISWKRNCRSVLSFQRRLKYAFRTASSTVTAVSVIRRGKKSFASASKPLSSSSISPPGVSAAGCWGGRPNSDRAARYPAVPS